MKRQGGEEMWEFRSWRAAVLAQVRFRPDRAAIEAELTAHYEDHVQDLERVGYDRQLAEQRALAAMGDPEEIGRALDKVHKPCLGWIWRLSRWLMVVLAITAVCAAWFLDGAVTVYERIVAQSGWEDPPLLSSHVELIHGDLWAAPGEVLVLDDGQYQAELELWLEMDSPAVLPDQFFSCLEMTVGGETLSQWSSAMPEKDGWRYNWEEGRDFYGWTRHHSTLKLLLDHPPEQAEITYPYGDNDWALRVEWGETS